MLGTAFLRGSLQHRGRVHRITGALLGPRCTPRRRLGRSAAAGGSQVQPARRLRARWCRAATECDRLADGDRSGRPGCGCCHGTRHSLSGFEATGIPRPLAQRPPALRPLTRFALQCRPSTPPKPLGTASGIVILILIVAATLADVLAPHPALALGAGKGGFQLRCRSQVQLSALQLGPHPFVAPAQPHRLDAPLRVGVGEAQLPYRVVEQAREPASQRQSAAIYLVEMVEDVHFEAALIGGQALGLSEELLIT